jgi:nicotinamide riboside kinase
MYVMKVWCEYVFNQCHTFILEQIVEQKCHLYLLCNIDLPWVKDELREYPDINSRAELYHIYKDILINQSVKWVEVSGSYEQRFNTAINAVDEMLTSS